ncbi:hypothetical protein [Shewanella jiangmenensis]|nr:hypothetical protein [Shewanella jiangmenensis]
MSQFFKENFGMILVAIVVIGAILGGIWWVEASLAAQETVL